ncbi:hypothetical protein KY290_033900 [Solanum tuberosum]|uniref:TTF-type domain-containing protein n=1 Tax=Solanum tuberosum TaxID=4113 RepID=A0ABQ7U1N9_SOLTU|nr:hypothetical protein KY289_033272 [Solanum tuberosum]KAH0647919.1 hypothetical protein KY285_033167 [Solanum tuberosum]KAH0740857.1 hypothetical protein KY290_033900 [Solanum tuberosum]
MDKFLIKLPKPKDGQPSSSSNQPFVSSQVAPEVQRHTNSFPLSNMDNILDFKSLEADPKDRMPISSYCPNILNAVRRYYIQKKPCQPVDHIFPKTKFGDKMRQFRPTWFKRRSQWLEYSIKADAAFCLCCYLFKNELESRENAGDSFTRDGFRCWNKALERFKKHVGKVNSIHHKCFNRMQDLKNQRQSIQSSFDKQSEKARSDYRMRLNASIDVARFLLTSGFPFRGHDESEGSEYKGAFLELLKWYGDRSFDVGRVILGNAPQNDMMICPTIQKDIVEACAKETTKAIIEDLDGDYFGILVDESKDVSHKEQMALILRYVNKSGMVIERFLGLSKKNSDVDKFFYVLTNILNTIGASFKRRDSLRQHQEDKLEELLKFGEVHTGQGLNQERGLQRPGDTRWGSHFKTLDNFLILFSSIVNVLKDMKRDCPYHLDRFTAENLLSKIHEFEFVFMLHLMFKVLLLTNELNKVLQKKDQDIVNAMGLLDLSKKRLQMMREDEWDSMMDEVSLFCGKHGISIPKMNEDYSNGKSKRKRSNISYLHHFRVEVFYAVIDLALQELNNRFDVVTSDLLLGMASLSPVDSFANFHKDRIMKLAEYYPSEFGDKELRELNFQLDDFIVYAQKCDSKFLNLKGIKDLAKVMIETKLDQTWSLVYLLVKLTLIIHVATASVERAFSSMKYIKNDLRNRMDEDLLNGCLVCYIERSIFKNIATTYLLVNLFSP